VGGYKKKGKGHIGEEHWNTIRRGGFGTFRTHKGRGMQRQQDMVSRRGIIV